MKKFHKDRRPYLNKRMTFPYKFTDFTHPEKNRHINQNDKFLPKEHHLVVIIKKFSAWGDEICMKLWTDPFIYVINSLTSDIGLRLMKMMNDSDENQYFNKNYLYSLYLLLLAFKTSNFVRCPISSGRPANWLLETCSSLKEVINPNTDGKVVKLQKTIYRFLS